MLLFILIDINLHSNFELENCLTQLLMKETNEMVCRESTIIYCLHI